MQVHLCNPTFFQFFIYNSIPTYVWKKVCQAYFSNKYYVAFAGKKLELRQYHKSNIKMQRFPYLVYKLNMSWRGENVR